MGCGKSKQAVATDNTVVTKTKSSNSIKINDPIAEKATKEENVQEFANVTQNDAPEAMVNKDECIENVGEAKENAKEKSGGNGNGESRMEDKAKDAAEEENFVGENGQEKLNSNDHSPRHFFSPKRDHEESIESIISEGISGKSEYYSPRAKGHVHEEKTDGNNAIEEEAKAEIKNEEGHEVDEVKEVLTKDETKESDTKGEENTVVGAQNDSPKAASPDDLKAN